MKFAVVALVTTGCSAFTRQQYSPLANVDSIWQSHMQPVHKKEVHMLPESQWKHDCGKLVPAFGQVSARHRFSLAQSGKDELPGAGMNPDEIEPFQKVLKDGFMEVACVKDEMYEAGDKFGNNKVTYIMDATVNSTIVHYTDHLVKEDREKMTPSVCFEFCRGVEDMGYFGISNGRDCYCTSFFKQMASDSSECDSVCEGDTSQMCGGKTKNTIWGMHWCDTLEEDITKAHNDIVGAHYSLDHLCSNILDTSEAVSQAAQELQDHFGQIGDPAASNLLQAANVFSGEWIHKAEDCLKLVDDLDVKLKDLDVWGSRKKDFTKYDTRKHAEDAMLAANDDTKAAVALNEKIIAGWTKAQPQAVSGSGKFLPALLAQYYSIMYFIDKEYDDDSVTPVTCDGDLIGDPVLGATPMDCAAACDNYVGECVGFMVLAAENGGDTGFMCYLFSSFTSAQYYTGCDAPEKKGGKGGKKFLQTEASKHGSIGGFETHHWHEHHTNFTSEQNATCAKMRASDSCATAREGTVAGTDIVAPTDKCYLKENNLWTHAQLPAYFNCLVACCEDYDPARIMDGITCDDIEGFGFGCSDIVPGHFPDGTEVGHICPHHCDSCAAQDPLPKAMEVPPPPKAMPPPPAPVVIVTAKDVPLDNPVQAMCRAKFSEFSGIDLKPDPMGKNKFALKELTKAARCLY